MEYRSETKTDPRLLDAGGNTVGAEIDLDPKSLEKIGRTGSTGCGSVAVLGNFSPRAGCNQRSHGGDIQGPRAVPSGSAGVDHFERKLYLLRTLAHADHQADDLVDTLPFCAQRR